MCKEAIEGICRCDDESKALIYIYMIVIGTMTDNSSMLVHEALFQNTKPNGMIQKHTQQQQLHHVQDTMYSMFTAWPWQRLGSEPSSGWGPAWSPS